MSREKKLVAEAKQALSQKKWEKANQLAHKIQIYNIASPEAFLIKGLSAFYTHNFKQAKQHFLESAKLQENAEILYRIGFTALYLQEESEAEKYFQKALDKDRKFAPAFYALAYLYQKRDDSQKALRYLERATQISPFPDLLMESPKDEIDLRERIQQLLASAWHKGKLSTPRGKRKAHPFDKAKRKAQLLMKKEQWQKAYFILAELKAKLPRDAEVLLNTGLCAFHLAHFRKATQLFQQAECYAPNNPEVYYFLGSSLAKEKKLAEAKRAFKRALVLQPSYPEACYSLGFILEKEGQLKEAYKMLEKAATLAPDVETLLHSHPQGKQEKKSFQEVGFFYAFFSLFGSFLKKSAQSLLKIIPKPSKRNAPKEKRKTLQKTAPTDKRV